jgi:hypothetical protein
MSQVHDWICKQKCESIDKRIEKRYSNSSIHWQKPKPIASCYLPSNRITLTSDVLQDIVSKATQVWNIQHDDGSVLYSGTRAQAERWMDKRKNVGELALVRGEK